MKGSPKWYGSLNLQNRLFFSYVCLILISLILFGMIYYKVAADSILKTAEKNVLNTTVKNLELVEKQLEDIEERAEWVEEEDDIKDTLKKIGNAKEAEVLALDSKVSSILDKYFYGENIVSAYLITPSYVLGSNSQVRVPISQFYQSQIYQRITEQDVKDMWFPTYFAQQEYQLDWQVEQSAVLTYSYLLQFTMNSSKGNQKKLESLLLVNLKTDFFRKIFEKTNNDSESDYCVSDQSGKIIIHRDRKKEGTIEQLPWLEQTANYGKGTMMTNYQGQKTVVGYAVSKRRGWVAACVYPVSLLLENVVKMQYVTYGITGLLLALALLAAMFFAQRITQPIESLKSAMKKAEAGDFSVRIPVTGNDEIQYLVSQYNEMGEKIEKLIEENYKSEIRNKESEIMALNLQLNPHFLYNTLNVINLMALEEGELEISKMVISVSDMMQYTFRNQRELVHLEEELRWLKNYTYIMQQRFEGKFEVIYEIAESISEYLVPKLLFEPLVENAIIHGFKTMDSGGLLKISCELKGGKMQLKVLDNGQGISKERLRAVLDGSAERIGVLNVKKRLTLIYGQEAEFDIQTEPNKGCLICIAIPCRL